MTQTQRILASIAAIILIGLLGFFVWRERQIPNSPADAGITTASSTDATTTTASGITTTGAGNYTITQLSGSGSIPAAPDYKSPLRCAPAVPSDQCPYFVAAAAAIAAKIDANPKDMALWINLGTVRKQAEDFQGAVVAWNYAALRLGNSNPTPYANLGDVYAYYLHDRAKAIANYEKAVAIYPEGIDLHMALGHLYQDAGRTTESKREYDIAIKMARDAGQTDLAAQLEKDRDPASNN